MEHKDVTIKHKDIELTFRIRPLTGKSLAQISAIEGMDEVRKQKSKKDAGEDIELTQSATAIWPMLQIVIPSSCVDPIVEAETPKEDGQRRPDILYLEEIPLNISTELLNEVFKLSGLSESPEAEEAVKN